MVTTIAAAETEVVALTGRVKKRRDEYLNATSHICAERAHLATQAWKETEGEPLMLRRAKIFKKIMEGLSVAILEDELIVGRQTKYVRGTGPSIEYRPDDVADVFKADKLTTSGVNPAAVSEAEKQSLIADAAYWKSRSVSDLAARAERDVFGDQIERLRKARLVMANEHKPTSSRFVDYGRVINEGLVGIIARAKDRIRKITYSDEKDLDRFYFLQAVIISCEALITFAGRYAAAAEDLAKKESDTRRKEELEEIAEICRKVPAYPASSFREALQSFWFVQISIQLESSGDGMTAGRMDQYLYPYYKHDNENGLLTIQQAAELLGCLWVKFTEIEHLKGAVVRDQSMSSAFQDVTLGGVTMDGKDASNELTYLLLEVARQLKTPQPPLYVRCHKGTPEELWMKAAEVNRDRGDGVPAFLNDEAVQLTLLGYGIPLPAARDWIAMGCVLPMINHACHSGSFVTISTPKVLELALNNGVDPRTGERLGLETGDATEFRSYEELYDAFKKQFEHFLVLLLQRDRMFKEIRRRNYALPFTSALLDDCVERGLSFWEGGVRYPQLALGVSDRGDQNVADSLVAVKKLVFEDRAITMSELLEALRVNFEGKEKIRQMLLAAPKYGNDNDYADEVFDDLSLWLQRRIHQEKELTGFPVRIGRGGATQHYAIGKMVGALPDGRKACEPLADGSLSPMRGADLKGPTAVINSASRVNHTESNTSTLFNIKINPANLGSRENLRKLISLIKTYFERGGYHIQFNLIGRDTLLEAKKHPENYRDLVVRVAGYSAFFVELVPEVQDEIIARTEHTVDW
ncbi:MAG: glycyl radical protein [Chloroflexi bacterium]|nr:glycyl radical protein [Chloroflexota bacterium]